MKVTPIILAAGESKRMRTPKPLLDFDGTSCLELILAACRRSKALPPVVVLGSAEKEIRKTLRPGTRFVVNPDYRRGQTSSLKAGLRALPKGADGFLLFPVDYPLVRPDTLDQLIDSPGEIAIPTFEGNRGHPARFLGSTVLEFLSLDDQEPAHRVARGDPSRVVEVPVEDPAVVRKLDTPSEFRACLEVYRGGTKR